ncbi:MAG: nitroreductase family protein [Bacillota bacterium]
MTKDVIDAINDRRSIREFTADDVPEATVTRLLEAACRAPSAGNRQPWFFYLVRAQKVKSALARAAYDQRFLEEAPWVIVVCAEPERSAERYGKRGRELYCIQDTAAAVQNILLAADGFGLGTCWVGAFDEMRAAQVLEIDPEVRRPIAMIPVGIPASRPSPRARRPVSEVSTVIR